MKTLQTIGSFMLVLLLVTAAEPAIGVGSLSLDDKDKKNDKKSDKKDNDWDSDAEIYAGTAKSIEINEPFILVLIVSKPSVGKVSAVNGFIATQDSFDSGGFLTVKGAYHPKSGEIKGRYKGKGEIFGDSKGGVDGEPIPGGFKVTIKGKVGEIVFGNLTRVDDDDDRGGKDNGREAGNKPEDNSKPGGKSGKPEDKAKPAAKPDPSKPAHTKPPSEN